MDQHSNNRTAGGQMRGRFARRLSGACATAVMLLVIGLTAPTQASAATTSAAAPDSSTVAAVRARMAAGGIPIDVQDRLIAKLQRGEALDSMLGTQPVTTTVEDTPSHVLETSIYPDGSRSWREVEKAAAPTGVSTYSSLSGCQRDPKWWVNCKVSISDAVSSASFVIDYHYSDYGAAQVRDMRSIGCKNLLGSCSVAGSIKRATQSSAGPAWAEMTYKASAWLVHASGAIGIRVSGTQVSTY